MGKENSTCQQKNAYLNKTNDLKQYSRNQVLLWISIILIVNLVLIIVWLFTSHDDSSFVSHFSFASTVTSIILSVLAIFMSVTGEAKTQGIRDRIEREAVEIVEVTGNLEIQMKELSGKIEIIRGNTDDIKAAVNLNLNPEEAQLATGVGSASVESIQKNYWEGDNGKL